MAMAPIEAAPMWLVSGVQVRPAFSVRHTPPPAVPM